MSDITIVTAFFDIGRGNLPKEKHGRVLPHYQHRSLDTYFDYFNLLAKIKNRMVIYTTQDMVDKIIKVRSNNGLIDKTKIVVLPTYLPDEFKFTKTLIEEIMNSPEYYGKIDNPQLIEYWHSDYVLVNIFKSLYVTDAIEKGFVETDLVAWIDFGYVRTPDSLPKSLEWSYPFDKEKIHFFNMRDIEPERTIDSIIYTGDVYIQGCHIVAGTKMWDTLKDLVMKNLNCLINYKLIDDDQTLLLMSYLTDPEKFELRYNSPHDWFRIFKDYNDA